MNGTMATGKEEGTSIRIPRCISARRHQKSSSDQAHTSGRTIVICLDGTGDKFDADNSNIVHLVSCLKKSDPAQVTYYQSGIGTYDGGGLANGMNAALDMAIGSGLGVHVRDAYKFLMHNYRQGDKICLFGFSRGAYTARCLAGMVHKVGLLPAHNTAQVPFAYQYYKDDSKKGWKMSADFKRTFCVDINIYFVGVFDSVSSVGVIPRELPLSATPKNKALHFRHAMALDERRAKFKACRYKEKDNITQEWDIVAAREDGEVGASGNTALDPKDLAKGMVKTDVEEVWFAGCHCDVGGGAVPNEQRHKLAQIPLRWMIRQAFECDTGILFKADRLAEEGIDVQTLYPNYRALGKPSGPVPQALRQKFDSGTAPSMAKRASVLQPSDMSHTPEYYTIDLDAVDEKKGVSENWTPEQAENYFDAVQPYKDQLKLSRTWWILEFLPVEVMVQQDDKKEEWIKKSRLNLGRYRAVLEDEPKLHWTVEERIKQAKYKVKARMSRQASIRFVS